MPSQPSATAPSTEPAPEGGEPEQWTGEPIQLETILDHVGASEGWSWDYEGRVVNDHLVEEGVYHDAGGWSTGYGEWFKSRGDALARSREIRRQEDAGASRLDITMQAPTFSRHFRPAKRAVDEGLVTNLQQVQGLFSLSWNAGPGFGNLVVDGQMRAAVAPVDHHQGDHGVHHQRAEHGHHRPGAVQPARGGNGRPVHDAENADSARRARGRFNQEAARRPRHHDAGGAAGDTLGVSSLWAPPEEQTSRSHYLTEIHSGVERRRQERAQVDGVFKASTLSDDPYLQELTATSRRVSSIGIDPQEFYKNPLSFQAVIEGPPEKPEDYSDPRPVRDWIKRMGQRLDDGQLLNQRGRLGFSAITGKVPIETALKQAQDLRTQMSDAEWLKAQKGINKQVGFAAEMVGQQLPNLPTALMGGAAGAGIGAGLGALAGGAVGGVGAVPGAGAGAAAGFGKGFMAGMFVENTRMMAGLSFLDLMETPLELPDGTEAQMPVDVARAVGMGIGAVNGAIEMLQVGTALGKMPGIKGLQSAANKALVKLVADGTIRRIAVRGGTQMLAGAGGNTAQEVLQETIELIGSEAAINYVEGKEGVKRQEAIDLADEWKKRMTEVVSLAPAFGMMSAPAAAIDVTTGAIQPTARRAMTPRGSSTTPRRTERTPRSATCSYRTPPVSGRQCSLARSSRRRAPGACGCRRSRWRTMARGTSSWRRPTIRRW